MIKGIGCDIVRIDRVAALLKRYGDRFKNRIFTEFEIKTAPSNANLEAAYYAKRFAAKEAFAKATGLGFGADLWFLDIEIKNQINGAPILVCNKFPDDKVHLSISDEKEFAIAYVVIS